MTALGALFQALAIYGAFLMIASAVVDALWPGPPPAKEEETVVAFHIVDAE